MNKARWLLALLVLVAACSAGPIPSASPSAEPSLSVAAPSPTPVPSVPATTSLSLIEALSYAPAGLHRVEFTDWARVKEQTGFGDLTSAGSDEDRGVFISHFIGKVNPPTPAQEYAASNLAQYVRFQRDAWGFDVLDLEWEAMIEARPNDAFAIALVVRLREGFALDSLVALFDERGYGSEIRPRATIWTHEIVSETWAITLIEMLNVAILDDGRTLIMASRPESLEPFLAAAADPSLAADGRAPFEAAAIALDDPTTAMLIDGPQLCTSIDPDNRPVSDIIQAEIDAAAPLNLYSVFGVGYSRAHDPIGRMVFVYGSSLFAETDLIGRQTLATSGHMVAQPERAYAEVFTVTHGSVAANVATLELAPYQDSPIYLFNGIYRRDMTYATCAL